MITNRRVVLVDKTFYFLPEMMARFPENKVSMKGWELIPRAENFARVTVRLAKDSKSLKYRVVVDTEKGFESPREFPSKSCIQILEFLELPYHIKTKENGKQVFMVDEFKKDSVVWVQCGFREPLSEEDVIICLALYFKELDFVIEFCRFIHTLETVPFSA